MLTLIPARFRRIAYALFAAAGVLVGALNVADVNTGKATDVLAYLGAALGLVAASNTQPPRTGNDEGGAADVGLLLLIAVLLGVGYLIVKLT